jgi:hypothetical protein
MMTRFANRLYQDVEEEWGDEVADAAAKAAAGVMLDKLEERLSWSVGELIDWERAHHFDPNAELRGKERVSCAYNVELAIQNARDCFS